MRVQLPDNDNLKRNVRRWRQETSTAPIPLDIKFPIIPDKYYLTTRDTIFLRKDTGPNSDRILIFFTDEQRNIMENATVSLRAIPINYSLFCLCRIFLLMERLKSFPKYFFNFL